MNPNDFSQMRFTVRRVSWWQIALVIAGALAIGTALALVAASVFLVVAPVVLLSGLCLQAVRRPQAGAQPARRHRDRRRVPRAVAGGDPPRRRITPSTLIILR